MGRIKFPEKRPEDVLNPRENIGFNKAIDLCIAAEKESRLSISQIAKACCEAELKHRHYRGALSHSEYIATAIHNLIYGEGER